MKLIDYGVRDDERPYIEEWSKDNNVEVKIVSDLLNPQTIEQAKGFDGVVAYQQLPYEPAILTKCMILIFMFCHYVMSVSIMYHLML